MTRLLLAPGRRLPLLLALVALFLLYPLAVELDRLRLFRFVFVGVLALATYSLGGRRKHLVTALVLGVPAALGQVVAYVLPEVMGTGVAGVLCAVLEGRARAEGVNCMTVEASLVAETVLAFVFTSYVTAVVMRSVLAAGPVTSDKIAGAISAYLLLGLVWAIAFGMLELLVPGSFRTPQGMVFEPGNRAEYAFIYYSFVTLTTLGYGEITPANPWGQTLAWTEAVVGQLFLAILIARLVALHIQHSRPDTG